MGYKHTHSLEEGSIGLQTHPQSRRGLPWATNIPMDKERVLSGYKHTHSQGEGSFRLQTHPQSRRGFLRATNTSTVKVGAPLGYKHIPNRGGYFGGYKHTDN